MKISDVALALYANAISKGGEYERSSRNTAEKAFEQAETFMQVRDTFLASHPEFDEGDGDPR